MKSADEIRRILAAEKPVLLERWGVETIALFGSYARGEAGEGSDVDLLVTFRRAIGWEVVDLRDHLEALLEAPVDLVTPAALKPLIAPTVYAEAQPA